MTSREALKTAAASRILLTDGAFGTEIQNYKLDESTYAGSLGLGHDQKGNNDLLALTRPDVVDAITRAYLAAGSDIVSTNTFSANRISQADYGAENLVREINIESARLARTIADEFEAKDGRPRFVAGALDDAALARMAGTLGDVAGRFVAGACDWRMPVRLAGASVAGTGLACCASACNTPPAQPAPAAVPARPPAAIQPAPGVMPVPDPKNLYSETASGKMSPNVAGALERIYVPNHMAHIDLGRDAEIDGRQLHGGIELTLARPVRPVHGHVGEPVEDLRATVLGHVTAHQPGALLDERGRHIARQEVGIVEDGLQERDVRGDAAEAELREGAAGPPDRAAEVAAAADQLHEHRVEVRRHLGPRGDRSAVEPDAGAAR